jgi:shikimate kinase
MIVVLFGQPGAGKTTLAKELLKYDKYYHIDGDELRELFSNKDYSREGRIKNLNRASDIATYLNTKSNVILSLVYPYHEARKYLNSLASNVKWILLVNEEDRNKSQFKVNDWEDPLLSENVDIINTNEPIANSVMKIVRLLQK